MYNHSFFEKENILRNYSIIHHHCCSKGIISIIRMKNNTVLCIQTKILLCIPKFNLLDAKMFSIQSSLYQLTGKGNSILGTQRFYY